MSDKVMHTIWLVLILSTAVILILFAHQYVQAEEVYVGMVSGLASIVAMRLAANGYHSDNKPPPGNP